MKTTDKKTITAWAVMKALSFECMSTNHIKMHSPKEGSGQPQMFIPIFNNRDDAYKFVNEGEENLILPMEILEINK